MCLFAVNSTLFLSHMVLHVQTEECVYGNSEMIADCCTAQPLLMEGDCTRLSSAKLFSPFHGFVQPPFLPAGLEPRSDE